MNILVKTTLRNIIGKPLRSFIVIFSIFVCAAAALFCFDLSIANNTLMDKLFKTMAGEGDISVSLGYVDLSRLPEDFPEYDSVTYRMFQEIKYSDVEGEYYVAHADRVRVNSIDIDEAIRMDLVSGPLELGDGQVIVTKSFANTYECDIGDTIILHDKNGEPVELEVVNIVPTSTFNLMRRGRACIVNENTGDVLSAGADVTPVYIFNIIDDSRIDEAESILRNTYADCTVSRLAPTESLTEGNGEMMGVMIMIFSITFLLVIFVTASLCQMIVSERMSYIGTLRSLGLSARTTSFILLIENVFYALIGSIPAVIIYVLIRDNLMGTLILTPEYNNKDILPSLSPLLVIGVIIGAVVIECIIPLRAQFKALKVSIRDIIFDNRDTEYKLSRFGMVLGIILAIVGIVTFFMRNNIFLASVCLICSVLALSFLFPLLLKKITSAIQKSSRKNDKERWALAAVEAGARKSAVGSGVLCVTTSTMCIIIFTIAMSIMGYFGFDKYDCDVVLDATKESTYYTFIERMDGVTDSELIYSIGSFVTINEIDSYVEFYGMPEGGFKMYTGFADVPSSVPEGSILLENGWATRNNINVGDTVAIVLNPNGVIPIEQNYTVSGLFKNLGSATAENSVIMAENDYITLFHDTPGMVLIRCEDPDIIASQINKYGVGLFDSCKTVEQIHAEEASSYSSLTKVFIAIIGVALGMTIIGMTSNQLIGFEGRRKECAVMLSTSMSKKTLVSILFRESFLSAVISGTSGLVVGSILIYVIKTALTSSPTLYLPIEYKPLSMILMWIGMILIFSLTVLFPIRSLNKMKISEQIKCE